MSARRGASAVEAAWLLELVASAPPRPVKGV